MNMYILQVNYFFFFCLLICKELILWLEKILFVIKNNNKFWYKVFIFILIIIKMKHLKVHIFDNFNIKI